MGKQKKVNQVHSSQRDTSEGAKIQKKQQSQETKAKQAESAQKKVKKESEAKTKRDEIALKKRVTVAKKTKLTPVRPLIRPKPPPGKEGECPIEIIRRTPEGGYTLIQQYRDGTEVTLVTVGERGMIRRYYERKVYKEGFRYLSKLNSAHQHRLYGFEYATNTNPSRSGFVRECSGCYEEWVEEPGMTFEQYRKEYRKGNGNVRQVLYINYAR